MNPNQRNSTSPPGSRVHSLDCKRIIVEECASFDGWKITALKAPILPSNCYCSKLCPDNSKGLLLEKSLLHVNESETSMKCQVCRYIYNYFVLKIRLNSISNFLLNSLNRYNAELKLKHYPEMVFPDNVLHLEHEKTGFILQFNCLDAMKRMSVDSEEIQVASSEVWKKSRYSFRLV